MAGELFGVGLVGERAVTAMLDRFPATARAALREEIAAIVGELLGPVKAAEPRRTGELRGETGASVTERGDLIRGRVGVTVNSGRKAEYGKAAALEYGAHRLTAVKAHARTITQVYGRLVAPTRVLVAHYERHADIAAQRFLRGPLAERHSAIVARLRAAIERAAAEG